MKIFLSLWFSLVLVPGAQAQVLPTNAVVDGKTISEWTAGWWKWIYSIPTNQNPGFDSDGSRAENGQSGPVFFLAGILSFSDTATRTFTVPEGKYLFLPILNGSNDNIDRPIPLPPEALRDELRAYVDSTIDLHLTIDGVSVTNLFGHRAASPVFSFDFPTTDNALSVLLGHAYSGLDDPIVSDGYWMMLEPLSVGTHRIEFGGTFGPPFNFSISISDTITVVPTNRLPVLATNAIVGGKTISDWTKAWNEWFWIQPTNQSPALDSDGSRATNRQDGPVFFVAGGFKNGAQPPRHYTVPADKYILIPLVSIQVENIGVEPPWPVEELIRQVDFLVENTAELHLGVDGIAATNLFIHRHLSPVYNFVLPSADNLFTWLYREPITGVIDPVVSDGYWAMLEPLSVGTHTLVFGGASGPPVSQGYERTDIITVVAVPPLQRVRDLISSIEASSVPGKRKQPLLPPLRKAAKSFEGDRIADGLARLVEFQNKVRQQLAPTYPGAAEDWARIAQNIIDSVGQPEALSNEAVVDGKTIADWSAEWWKWVLPISTNNNPMLDTNGAFANVAQPDGSVFLVGAELGLTPGIFTRTFSIPETKYLFAFVLAYLADNFNVGTPLSVEELREQAKGIMDARTNLQVSIDGVTITSLLDHRAISPVFNIFYTNADNLHSFAYGIPATGLIDPLVSDGYWLMLEPLPPGQHVLRIDGDFTLPFFFGTHVVDHIHVTPVPLSEWMSDFIAAVQQSGLAVKAQRPLLQTLNRAEKAFARNRSREGIAHLLAFEHQVRARLGRTNPVLAEYFIRRAERTLIRATRED